jgi:hypothetical protein
MEDIKDLLDELMLKLARKKDISEDQKGFKIEPFEVKVVYQLGETTAQGVIENDGRNEKIVPFDKSYQWDTDGQVEDLTIETFLMFHGTPGFPCSVFYFAETKEFFHPETLDEFSLDEVELDLNISKREHADNNLWILAVERELALLLQDDERLKKLKQALGEPKMFTLKDLEKRDLLG